GVQEHDVVGDLGGLVEVVQHDADRDAVHGREVAHQVEQLHLVAQVEVGGRLVEQEHARVLGEAGGEPDALQLSPGQLVDAAVRHGCHARDLHGVPDGAGAV